MRSAWKISKISGYVRWGILAITLSGSAIPMLAAAEDLLQTYQLARNNDPLLAAAEAQKGSIAEGVNQARANLLPQISASISYGQDFLDSASLNPVRDQNGNFILAPIGSSSDNYNRSYRGQLNQSLYDHSNYTRLKQSRAQAARGEIDYAAAAQDLILRVATNYFAVLTAEDQQIGATLGAAVAFKRALRQAQRDRKSVV